MKKILFTLAMVSVLALGSADLFARGGKIGQQDGQGRDWQGRGPNGSFCSQAIPDLTAEQSEKIQALEKKHFDETASIRESIFKKNNELRSQWMSKEPDQAKVNALQKDISDLRLKMQEKATNLKFDIRKLLTPDQLAKYPLDGPGFGGRHGGMGGPGMGMGRW